MFSADFPITFQAGLHARPLGHLTNLGLTIDGKRLSADNPEMAEYEAPHSTPDRVVRLAADTGDPDHDRRLVQYGKATIQSGDGPFRHVAHPMSAVPEHIAGAMQALEADPNWQPYITIPPANAEYVRASRSAGWHEAGPLGWEDRVVRRGPTAEYPAHDMGVCPNCMRARLDHGRCPGCGYEEPPSGYDPDSQPGGYDNPQEPYGDWQEHKAGHFYAPGTRMECSDSVSRNGPRGCGHQWTSEDGSSVCPNCGQPNGESEISKRFHERNMYEPDTSAGPGGWVERPQRGAKTAGPMMQFQQERGDFAGDTGGNQGTTVCPNCGTLNVPGSVKCAKCGHKIGLEQPNNQGGPSDAHSNPYTGNPPVTGGVTSEMSKWHLADLAAQAPGMQQQPDTADGPFNDHRDVSEMSTEQSVGHERLVNIVVDEMNKVISGGGAVDATLINNLVQWLVDKFGQDADSAQAIVDAATKQAQTSDGRLDNTPVVPDPAEQAVQPTQGDVMSDPNQVQNSGAFSHVRTPSGKIGHVVESWEDMYGEKWAMVATSDGARESVYADELEDTTSPEPENAVEELQAFIAEMEPVEARVASIRARIANMRILKQEIRRHMSNPRLTMEQRLALDQMDADASIEMLELTDAVPQLAPAEQAYLDSQTPHGLGYVVDEPPTMFGVEEIEMPEAAEPEWTNEALDAYLPEEAEILVSEAPAELRSDPNELAAVAAAHVDRMTAGHAPEVRAHHRDRFVTAVHTVAADYATNDEADTTESESYDWDGPAEAIFAGEV